MIRHVATMGSLISCRSTRRSGFRIPACHIHATDGVGHGKALIHWDGVSDAVANIENDAGRPTRRVPRTWTSISKKRRVVTGRVAYRARMA